MTDLPVRQLVWAAHNAQTAALQLNESDDTKKNLSDAAAFCQTILETIDGA